jgi:hypothetical protein
VGGARGDDVAKDGSGDGHGGRRSRRWCIQSVTTTGRGASGIIRRRAV